MRFLTDDDVRAALDRRAAVEVIRGAIRDSELGRLSAPPRKVAELGEHRLVFTSGGDDEVVGFRAYGRPGMLEEIVAVWNRASGHLEAAIVGRLLGPLRTGSIGAVAVDVLARPDAITAVVIGSGRQARAQLAAVAQVRDLTRILVTSPTAAHRENYVLWAHEELGLEVESTGDVRSAVEAADIVLCATVSEQPVLEASWLQPGTHLTTMGPNGVGDSEVPVEVIDGASHLVTDAPAQLASIGADHQAHGRDAWDRIRSLGELVDGGFRRGDDDITVFLSIGLAGTEVALARWFAAQD